MTGNFARVTFDRTVFPVAAGAIEARRLETHRVDVGVRRPEAPRLVLDRLDQPRPVVLAPQFLLDPEQLDEQNRCPDFSDDASDGFATLAQGDGKALVLLLAHLLGVVSDQSV